MAVRFHQALHSLLGPLLGMGFLTLLVGCSGGEDLPDTYPASGTVLYNGDPVEGATVVFRSQGGEKTHIATGMTDAQGKFSLSTGSQEGAVAGTHSVTVTKMTAEGGSDQSLSMEEAAEQEESSQQEAKSEIPLKYSNTNESPLKEEVTPEGPNEFQIELTD